MRAITAQGANESLKASGPCVAWLGPRAFTTSSLGRKGSGFIG